MLDGDFKPRLYQERITATAVKKNTLCILPTGMGKTFVGIMVANHRLNEFPNSKILMLAPTRPLVNQHFKRFKEIISRPDKDFIALTGKIHARDRKVLYTRGKLFFATPQLIRNDIENKILDLASFSLLIVDECHRSVKRYAYTSVVGEYVKQSSNPLILGLTASPGGIQEKIDEVKENLRIKAVEIRTEKDVDVEPYIQDIAIQQVYVELPEEFKSVRRKLEEVYREKLNSLMRMRLLHSMRVSKRTLLDLQKEVGKLYQESKDYMTARALTLCAQAIKLEHAIMLIETEGVSSLQKYFSNTLKKQKSMATRRILKDSRIASVIRQTEDMYVKGVEHPKMKKMLDIIEEELKKNPRSKIIVFANYRSAVDKIAGMLQANKIEAREFIGQAVKSGKGLNQKRQIELLNEFGYEMFNVLVSTSVGEEGIDVPAVDLAIFYEPVPSEIRTIQRRGRTGRQKAGRVIFLITKGTRDEGYYWSAYHKERRMKRIIKNMKDGFKADKTKKLKDFID